MLVVVVLWTAFFVINFNVAMMIPLLPFIHRDIGLSSAQAAMVLVAFPIVALTINLAIRPFSDRLGRKKFIVTGATGCAIVWQPRLFPHPPCRSSSGALSRLLHADDRRLGLRGDADYIPAQNRAR